MAAYADYAYYRDSYRGSAVSEADFPGLAVKASAYVRAITFGRADADREEVKDATCSAAEMIQQLEKERSGTAKSSESVGSWSVSYLNPNSLGADERTRLSQAVDMYLAGTGLMYAGVDRCFPTP
ncbi:hypothetical protein [Clostridium minihomine]|uniref:hypothetical protein n=1 Tax=Clostridium minihomine TaxID=2045012 RepID=UPI000C75DE26|nr:hypothetical protein [Clostridium minihomine]